ncbi:MAG TPA: N-(5'-phosphoribosyl)anthranilate isomerase [Deltaproteobacteria bacterium]|nr:N-(5'-phosphoribosyl)anthranilate isomerase [Deltaproteobacteria bacterium]
MTKIKICGITNLEDALGAAKAGADYLGFNFYGKSPRFIETAKAKRILHSLRKKYPQVKIAGIFVDKAAKELIAIANDLELWLIQLHGEEGNGYIGKLQANIKIPIMKAFRIKGKESLHAMAKTKADYVLLDSYQKGIKGGTGRAFDWSLVRGMEHGRLFLSGGLKPENVSEAIERVAPYAVDVCSGIETQPGKKSIRKMHAFIRAVRKKEQAA